MTELYRRFMEAKEKEAEAVEYRRSLEQAILGEQGFDGSKDGSLSFVDGPYRVTMTARIDRKVNLDELNQIAVEHGLENIIKDLFRYKAEVNIKEWRATDEGITRILSGAVTVKPGRPSLKISLITDQEEENAAE